MLVYDQFILALQCLIFLKFWHGKDLNKRLLVNAVTNWKRHDMFIFLPGSESYQSFWNIHPIRTQILWTSWPAVNQWTVYWTKSNRNCWPAKDAGKKDWNAFKSCININQFQVFLCNLPVDWILHNLFFIAFDIILLFISSWEDKWGREADSSHPDPHGCAPCRPIQHWSTHHRGWGL